MTQRQIERLMRRIRKSDRLLCKYEKLVEIYKQRRDHMDYQVVQLVDQLKEPLSRMEVEQYVRDHGYVFWLNPDGEPCYARSRAVSQIPPSDNQINDIMTLADAKLAGKHLADESLPSFIDEAARAIAAENELERNGAAVECRGPWCDCDSCLKALESECLGNE